MRLRLSVVALIGSAVVGCGDGNRPDSTVEVRDSLGIRIIENELPVWSSESPAWIVDSTPSVVIEGDPSSHEYFLHRVVAVQLTADGRIAVANRGTVQILLFDSTAHFLGGVGGQGEGPGEFSSVFDLFRCAGDTLVVYEGVRLSLLNSHGTFARTELIAGRLAEGRGNMEGLSADCSSILLIEGRERPPRPGDGVYQMPSTLYWSSLDGNTRDTVLNFPGAEAYPAEVSGGLYFLRLPFGEEPVWTVREDQLYYGAADQFEIFVIDRLGRTKDVIRWSAERRRVTDADWQLHEEGHRWLMQEDPSLRGNYPEPEDFPRPDTKPAYNGLLVDDQGNMWVRQYEFEGWYRRFPTDQVWWVFDRSGRWLGAVQTPPGLRVLTVQHEMVIGVARDEDDVEHVMLYRLNDTDGG